VGGYKKGKKKKFRGAPLNWGPQKEKNVRRGPPPPLQKYMPRANNAKMKENFQFNGKGENMEIFPNEEVYHYWVVP